MAIGLGFGILLIIVGVARMIGLTHDETPSSRVDDSMLVR